MQTAKQEVETMLQQLPEDSTFEDIHYHLYVLEKIKRGEERAETEGTFTQEEAEVRFSRWTTK